MLGATEVIGPPAAAVRTGASVLALPQLHRTQAVDDEEDDLARPGHRGGEPRRELALPRVRQLPQQGRHHTMEAGPVRVGQQRLRHGLPHARSARPGAPPRSPGQSLRRSRRDTLRPRHPPTTWGPVASVPVRVSTRGDYASRALLSLALHGAETPTSVRDIAERTGLPQPYLEQILLALKGAGLVRSKRGVGGGYVLARPPGRSPWPRSCRLSTARSPRGISASPTPTAPATTRASASVGRVGRRGRDDPHPSAVLQPGRHGRPGPGQRRRRSTPA